MARWIVKINRYKDQFRITIPKSLAAETCFSGAEFVELKVIGVKKLEVVVFEQEKSGGERGA